MSEKKYTTVEQGTTFDGSIESDRPVMVGGTVKGRLKAPELTVTPEGRVDGIVNVSTLSSSGQLSGTIDADSATLSGRVNDGTVIQARSLEVTMSSDAPSVKFGNCELRVGQPKGDGKNKVEATTQQKKKGAAVV